MNIYFKCHCHYCGWHGMSDHCNGGEKTFDDYNDIRCPICDNIEPDEYKITPKEWIKIVFYWLSFKYIREKIKKWKYVRRLEKIYSNPDYKRMEDL